jgi:hypothetical protein
VLPCVDFDIIVLDYWRTSITTRRLSTPLALKIHINFVVWKNICKRISIFHEIFPSIQTNYVLACATISKVQDTLSHWFKVFLG